MYTLNETGYSFYLLYNSERGQQQENIENINILYINENHFNLLIPNLYNIQKQDDLIRNNININNLKSIILKQKIDERFENKFIKKIVFKYPCNGLTNYYNEIFI